MKETVLAKPNYSFEKRQRELAKKKKQEEKRQRHARPKGDDGPASNGAALHDTGAADSPPAPGDSSSAPTSS